MLSEIVNLDPSEVPEGLQEGKWRSLLENLEIESLIQTVVSRIQ